MRILLYTGKGGVGKTSVAAATALRCADLGYRTVVVSTDAAHSLADSFDIKIGNEPIEIAPRLKGQEIDILHQMDETIVIPQAAQVESLNAGVAASIVLYEAARASQKSKVKLKK